MLHSLGWAVLGDAAIPPQLSRFLWDHGDIAFAPLGRLMLENFRLEGNKVSKCHWLGKGSAASLVGPGVANLTGLPCRATRKR